MLFVAHGETPSNGASSLHLLDIAEGICEPAWTADADGGAEASRSCRAPPIVEVHDHGKTIGPVREALFLPMQRGAGASHLVSRLRFPRVSVSPTR